MNTLLDPRFLALFSGGTLDFRSLGREMTAGIDNIEILLRCETSQPIKIRLWWTAEISDGKWKPSTPPIDSMTTEISFLKEMESLGQNRFRLHFKLGDAEWSWTLKPRHKDHRVTFEVACGLEGTSS